MNKPKYHLSFIAIEWIIYIQLMVSTWVQNSHDNTRCSVDVCRVPGWPLENPPPVAGSKSPTPVVGRTGVI